VTIPTVNPKDPDATLDYTVDWRPFLTSISDTGATATFVVSPPDELVLTSAVLGSGLHTVFIAGGTLHRVYRVTSRLTTTGGRIQDQSFFLPIEET
jgi:hypothetical protein